MANWIVTLSPAYDKYLGLNDLEKELSAANLLKLLPANHGVQASFKRTVKGLASEGIELKQIKQSPRDISWAVEKKSHRKPIGSILLTYGRAKDNTVSWTGSRIKVKTLVKSAGVSETMNRINAQLKEALDNPGVNAYTFHLRVLKLINTICINKIIRTIAYSPDSQVNYSYVIEDKNLPMVEKLAEIYAMFGMKIVWKKETS